MAAIAIVRVIGILRGRTRPGRDDLAWAVPAVAFAAWQVVVKAATGSVPLLADSGRNAGAPFVAPLEALKNNLAHVYLHQFEQYDLWLLELAILAFFAIAALLSLRSTKAPTTNGWPSCYTWSRSASSRRAPGTAWTPTCGLSSRCTCWP